jgi:hypothetical protein
MEPISKRTQEAYMNLLRIAPTLNQEMGILVNRTPKCHCELAGKGIEYSWGCTKNLYRKQPLKMKRGKESFRSTVRRCFLREINKVERVWLFSQRAWAYMLAYQMLQEQKEQGLSSAEVDVKNHVVSREL